MDTWRKSKKNKATKITIDLQLEDIQLATTQKTRPERVGKNALKKLKVIE